MIPFYERAANFAMVTLIIYAWLVLIAFCLHIYKKYIVSFTTAQIDGLLYTMMGMWIAIQGVAQSEEIYRYCNPYMVFYGKSVVTVMLAGATALKTFRSRSYGDEQDEKKKTGQTEFLTKP